MKFLDIIHSWESYFDTFDEGLGTTYERFILHRYFRFLKDTYDISSVLEVPSFGMTGVSGINSLWWAGQGIETTVTDNNPSRISQIQEVWNNIPLQVNLKQVVWVVAYSRPVGIIRPVNCYIIYELI